MKNNKKGFTLIELLAVIVILAIIALIATPIVLNIIAKARKSAAQDSLYGVISAAKTTYMSSLLDVNQVELPATIKCSTEDGCVFYDEAGTTKQSYTPSGATDAVNFVVSFSGTIPTSGSFTINKDGIVEDVTFVAADAGDKSKGIWVNGFQCKVEKEKVTCS